MNIIIARYAGFCNGVRKAILKISSILQGNSTPYIHGPLIHNPQTISILSKRGLILLDQKDSLEGKDIVVRTHGIPFQEYKTIKSKARKCINLTCSRVARIQGIIKKYSQQGYFILITGNANHPEVQSFISYAPEDKYYILSTEKDINSIPPAEKYILVSQTTIDLDFFNNIAKILNDKYKNIPVKIINTICEATHKKQHEIHSAISKGIDTLVVVGGKNSSNTKHLADIGRQHSITTFHIETETELTDNDLKNSHNIFVTAGASTPDWIISNVITRLHEIAYVSRNILFRVFFTFLKAIFLSEISLAILLFFYTAFLEKLLTGTYSYTLPLYNAAIIFMLLIIKNKQELPFLQYIYPLKYTFLNTYKSLQIVLCGILGLLAIYRLSLFYNNHWTNSLLYIVSYLCVTSRWFQKHLTIKFIKILTNKNMLLSLISSLLVIIPLASRASGQSFIFLIYSGMFLFILLLTRNLTSELLTYQADNIFGISSFLTLTGKNNGNIVILCLQMGLIFFTGYSILFYKTYTILYFLPILLYQLFQYRIVMKKHYGDMLLQEILSDVPLLLVSMIFFLV